MIDETRRQEIRERMEKAGLFDLSVVTPITASDGDALLCSAGREGLVARIKRCITPGGSFLHNSRAYFFAHAPTDIRDLLAGIDALEAQVKSMYSLPAELDRARAALRERFILIHHGGPDFFAWYCGFCRGPTWQGSDTQRGGGMPEVHLPVTLTIDGVETTGPCPARPKEQQ